MKFNIYIWIIEEKYLVYIQKIIVVIVNFVRVEVKYFVCKEDKKERNIF